MRTYWVTNVRELNDIFHRDEVGHHNRKTQGMDRNASQETQCLLP